MDRRPHGSCSRSGCVSPFLIRNNLDVNLSTSGSLFNHSDHPNLSYTLDTKTDSIRYTTVRDINPDEELCIFYGHNIWFTPAPVESDDDVQAVNSPPVGGSDDRDGWGGLGALDHRDNVDVDEGGENQVQIVNPYAQGDPDEIIPEEDLPLSRFKLPLEEEDPDSIRTSESLQKPRVPTFKPFSVVQAWVIDIPDQKYVAPLLK